MKRLFQTLLAAVGILALVLVGVVVYVTTFFDPEDLKPRLVEVVREESGLELSLEGPLSWSFYPRLGVSVEKAEAWLPDQEMQEDPSFAAFQRAEVSLVFAPLLRGEIAIDGVILDGMRLNLERDEQGRGNWEVLLERLGEHRANAEGELGSEAGTRANANAGNLGVDLNIASVQLRHGEIRFRDLQLGREFRLEEVNISGSNVNPNGAFPVTSTFRLLTHERLDWQELGREPRLVSDVSLESRVSLVLAERRYVFESLVLDTTSRLAGTPGEQKANLRSSELLIDVIQKRLSIKEGKLEASLAHPLLGDKTLPLSLAFLLDADLGEQTAHLREIQLTGENALELSGNLSLSRLFEDLTYRGQMSLAPLSLRPWLGRFGSLPEMASDSALTDFALTSPIQGDLERVELDGLTLALDDSTFTGRLALGLEGQLLEFDFEGDRLDLDAYLPPESAVDTASLWRLPVIGRAHAADPGALVPAEWLSHSVLQGQLSLGQLHVSDLDFSEVSLEVSSPEDRLRLVSFESDFHEGTLAASGEIGLANEPLSWTLTPQLTGVRLDSLLESLGEEPALLRGRLTSEGELRSRGNTWPELQRNLNGRLSSRIDEGAMFEVNVSRELCAAVATLEGRETQSEWSPDTRFDHAEAIIEFRDGVAHSDDILITIPGIELAGQGQLDLISERFDLQAAARFVDTADAACRVNPRLTRVPFPVRCEGNLAEGESSDWCRLDLAALQATLAEQLGAEIGEEVERGLEGVLEDLDQRLGEGAGEELRDTLRGLLD